MVNEIREHWNTQNAALALSDGSTSLLLRYHKPNVSVARKTRKLNPRRTNMEVENTLFSCSKAHATTVDVWTGDVDFKPAHFITFIEFPTSVNIFFYRESTDISHHLLVENFF